MSLRLGTGLGLTSFGAAVAAGGVPAAQTIATGSGQPAGTGGWMPVDASGDPLTIASITDQTGTTRTWSVNALGQLVADGDPLVDDTKTITVLTDSGDTVVGTLAVDATAYFIAGQTDQTATSADMDAIELIGTGISGKTIYFRPSAQVARLQLANVAVTSEITFTNEVASKPATASQILLSTLGASGSVRVEDLTVDGSLYTASIYSIVHLLGTGANFTMDGCTIKGNFDPIGNGYVDNDYRYNVNFTGKTGTFAIGEQLTGGTSTGDAEILDVLDNGDGTGTLWLNDQPANIAETFISGEVITSSGGATATTTSAAAFNIDAGLDGLVCGTGCSWDNVTFTNGLVYNIGLPFKTLLSGNGQTTITDNTIHTFYGDGFKPVSVSDTANPSPFNFSGNEIYDCMTDPTDANNPHTDIIQPSGASITAVWPCVCDDNLIYIGPKGRALTQQVFFLVDTNGNGHSGSIRNNVIITASVHAINVTDTVDMVVANNTVARPNLSDTFATVPTIGVGASSNSNTSVRNNVSEVFTIGSGVFQDNNLTLGASGATVAYATAFAPSSFTTTPTTLAETLTAFTPQGSGPMLAGATYVVGDIGCIDSTSAFVPFTAASTPPLIASSVPADDATGVAITVDPTVTFTSNMAFGTGNITLYDVTNTTNIEVFDVAVDTGGGAGTVSISGNTLTIEPTADLSTSVEYAIKIDATALDDTSGISFAGITDNTTLSFSTTSGTVTDIMAGVGDFSSATGWTLGTDCTITGGVLQVATSANFANNTRVLPDTIPAPENTTLDLEYEITSFTSFGRIRFQIFSYNSSDVAIDSNTTVYDTSTDGAPTGVGVVSKANVYTTPAGTASVRINFEITTPTTINVDNLKLTY